MNPDENFRYQRLLKRVELSELCVELLKAHLDSNGETGHPQSLTCTGCEKAVSDWEDFFL